MRKTLQNDRAMKLVLCDCGKLHVTWGTMTMHFTRDEFLVFSESIRRLAAIVAQPAAAQTSVTVPYAFTNACH